MHWGTSLWYFFHTYAEKINDSFFKENRVIIINQFITCINLLPCPLCQEHAKNNLKNYNLNLIKNKENYKEFLLKFHNDVNKNLKKQEFTLNELNNKYSKANFNNIIINANNNFTKNIHLSRNLNDSMLRKMEFSKILNFIKVNKNNFVW